MLASDYLLQGAVSLLKKVRDGKLRLDRTIEVSVTNTAGKEEHARAAEPESENARSICSGRIGTIFTSPSAKQPADASCAARPGAGWFAAATRRCG